MREITDMEEDSMVVDGTFEEVAADDSKVEGDEDHPFITTTTSITVIITITTTITTMVIMDQAVEWEGAEVVGGISTMVREGLVVPPD